MNAVDDEQAKKNLALNLRRMLDDRGWSQRRLALATGETPMTISNILAEKHITNVGTVSRIAACLDTSVDLLLGTPKKQNFVA